MGIWAAKGVACLWGWGCLTRSPTKCGPSVLQYPTFVTFDSYKSMAKGKHLDMDKKIEMHEMVLTTFIVGPNETTSRELVAVLPVTMA